MHSHKLLCLAVPCLLLLANCHARPLTAQSELALQSTKHKIGATVCLDELSALMPVVSPSSPDWDKTFPIHNPLYNGNTPQTQPAFVAQPLDTAHIQQCLQCAVRNNLTVAVRAGGHSFAGFSTTVSPAFVLSLSHMRDVCWFNGTEDFVAIQAGATWNDVYMDFRDHGGLWVVAGGLCPTVGAAGFTMGGGVGPVERRFGMGIDSLFAIEMVLANGTGVVTASATENEDLFWAVRGGGGGNFGVVSKMIMRTHTGPIVYSWGKACFDNNDPSTAAGLHALATNGPPLVHHANLDAEYDPDGGLCLWLIMQGTSEDANGTLSMILDSALSTPASTTTTVVAPRLAAPPEIQQFSCFYELILAYAAAKGYSNTTNSAPFTLKSCFVDGDKLPELNSRLFPLPTPTGDFSCGVSMIQFGGVIAQQSPTATAFPYRQAAYMVYISCGWDDPKMHALASEYLADLYHKISHDDLCYGAYVNFVDPDLPVDEFEEKYYGVNAARLRQVKKRWNPMGSSPLRFPQEIRA